MTAIRLRPQGPVPARRRGGAPRRLRAGPGRAGAHDALRRATGTALDGVLDPARLRALHPETAMAEIPRIHGVGPFSAELSLVRGAGAADHLPARAGTALMAGYHHGHGSLMSVIHDRR